MDTEQKISKITVEALDTKKFDDLFIEGVQYEELSSRAFRIQVKNYPDTKLKDIKVNKNTLHIAGNKNEFEPADNNILVVNTALIETDDSFMGLPCTKADDIIIIPLTPEQTADKMDNMFSTDSRELQIIHKADDVTENAKFEITIDDLPEIIQMSIDLENETILLRNVPDDFKYNITFIEGKPVVGKSHFVNEICEKYPDAIIYRFWIGSQEPYRNQNIRVWYWMELNIMDIPYFPRILILYPCLRAEVSSIVVRLNKISKTNMYHLIMGVFMKKILNILLSRV